MQFEEDDPFNQKSYWADKIGLSSSKYTRPASGRSNNNNNAPSYQEETAVEDEEEVLELYKSDQEHDDHQTEANYAFANNNDVAKNKSISLALAEPFRLEAVKRLFNESVQGGELDDVASNYDYTDSSEGEDDDESSSDSEDESFENDRGGVDAFGRQILPKPNPKSKLQLDQDKKISSLTPTSSQIRYITHKLLTIQNDRPSIGHLMFWFIKHSHLARSLFDFLISAIISTTCPIQLQLNRFYLLSDILFNSQCGFTNAWQYRALVDLNGGGRLECIIDHFAQVWKGLGRVRAEGVRKSVLAVLAVWESWGIFTVEYVESLRQRFTLVIEKRDASSSLPVAPLPVIPVAVETNIGANTSSNLSSATSTIASSKLPMKIPLKKSVTVSKFKPIDSSVPSGFVPIDVEMSATSTSSFQAISAPAEAEEVDDGKRRADNIILHQLQADKKVRLSTGGAGIPIYRASLPSRNFEEREDDDDEEDMLGQLRQASKVAPKPKAFSAQMKLAIKSDQSRFEGDRQERGVVDVDPSKSVLLTSSVKKKKIMQAAVMDEAAVGTMDGFVDEWDIDDSVLLHPNPEIDGEALRDDEI